jgi:4,4'-diaponeurosporenoate glycosyltransferase
MTSVLTLVGWLAGWLLVGHVRRLPAVGGAVPSISLIIPARNEEERLPALLAALAADKAEGGSRDLIVVDDGSSDGSAALAARAGAIVAPTEPPTGWTGKSWACQHGASHAKGEVLVFLDADTTPAPGFVARLAAAAAAADGMVSVQPTHRVERIDERASAVASLVALMAGTGNGRSGHWWRRPVAFGPAVAVPSRIYRATGGHELVRADVAEDIALAQAMAARGVPVAAFADAGEGAIEYRMYAAGPRALVEGWSKNLAAGASKIAPMRAIGVGLWVTGAFLAIRSPVSYAMYAAQLAVLLPRAGRFGVATPLVYPLPLLAFTALFARSLWCRARRRPVTWRGRWVAP